MSEIQTCSACNRKFEATVVGGGMSSPEMEQIKCPYCGFVRMALTSGRFITRRLPDDATVEPKDADASK